MFLAHEVSLSTAGPFQPRHGGRSSRPPVLAGRRSRATGAAGDPPRTRSPPPSSAHPTPGGCEAPGSPARGYTSSPAGAGSPAAASGSAESREAARGGGSAGRGRPRSPRPLTSSSSSTTCCSSSTIRAFFLSRALWAATRFFSFLRGRAAVSPGAPLPCPPLPAARRPSPAQRLLLRAQVGEPLPLAGRLRGLQARGGGSCRQDNGDVAAGGGWGLGRFAGDEEQPGGRGTGQRCHGGRGADGGRGAARRPDWRPSALPAAPPGFLLSWLFLIGRDGVTIRPG